MQLCTGVHGRLDDGRCLVEKLPANSHDTVKYRLAPEDAPEDAPEGAPEHSSQALASQATASASDLDPQPADPSADQATESADNEAADADATVAQGDTSPAQNLQPEGSSTLQPRYDSGSLHEMGAGERLEAANFAQLQQTTASVAIMPFLPLSGNWPDLVPAIENDRNGSQRTTALQGRDSQPSGPAVADARPVRQHTTALGGRRLPQGEPLADCMGQLPGLSNHSSHSEQTLTLRLEATPDAFVPQPAGHLSPPSSSGNVPVPTDDGMHGMLPMELATLAQARQIALSLPQHPAAKALVQLAQTELQAVLQQQGLNAAYIEALARFVPSVSMVGAEPENGTLAGGMYADDEMQVQQRPYLPVHVHSINC